MAWGRQLYDIIIEALCFQNEVPIGCVQTWWDFVEEFVHSAQARFHLRKILHGFRLHLLKLQEECPLFQPTLSTSDEEARQALLVFLHIRRPGEPAVRSQSQFQEHTSCSVAAVALKIELLDSRVSVSNVQNKWC